MSFTAISCRKEERPRAGCQQESAKQRTSLLQTLNLDPTQVGRLGHARHGPWRETRHRYRRAQDCTHERATSQLENETPTSRHSLLKEAGPFPVACEIYYHLGHPAPHVKSFLSTLVKILVALCTLFSSWAAFLSPSPTLRIDCENAGQD